MSSQIGNSKNDTDHNQSPMDNDQLNYEECTDAQLVGACLMEDEAAWESLIVRYSALVYAIPLRFGFSQSVADEVFQEICLFLMEKLETLRDHDRLHPWLVTVTRRTCLQRMRKVKITVPIDSVELRDDEKGMVDERLVRVEQQALVRQAVAALGPRCRRLINALFLDEDKPSYETLAVELDIPLGSIGPTRARCLNKLRDELASLEQAQASFAAYADAL